MNASEEIATRQPTAAFRWLGRLFRLALVLAILGTSGVIAYHWMMNRPKAERRAPSSQATLVEVMPIRLGNERVVIQAMGTVVPAKTIQLAARISGQIVHISDKFVPGGMFDEAQEILRIDRKDYELAVAQQEGNVTRMESDMRLEMGQQAVARREFELLGDGTSENGADLLLRQPQLAAKQASLLTAQAVLDKARLDLERTSIGAPFNAVVQARNVDLGSYVAPGTPLATLAYTDEFWVEVSVPVDELRWIDLPAPGDGDGAPARIYNESAWGPDAFRAGNVERLMPEVETRGRMARLLVAVEDPLERQTPDAGHPLLLSSFVRVEIDGKTIEGVSKVPRSALHGGNVLRVMLPDKTLDLRAVEVAWGGPDEVYVTGGIQEGEMLVVSDLAAAFPGMLLRTAEDGPAGAGPGSPRKNGPA